jgi:hypothetical protein
MKALVLISSLLFVSLVRAEELAPVDVLKAGFEAAEPANLEDFPRFVDLALSATTLKCEGVIYGETENPKEASLTPMLVGAYNFSLDGKTISTSLSPVVNTDEPQKYKTDDDLVHAMKGLNIQLVEPTRSQSGDLETVYPVGGMQLHSTYRKKGSELFVHETIGYPDSHADAYVHCN